MSGIIILQNESQGGYINRVGHLILRALAIQASNPQNALARISFHSPKSLPPPPPHLSNHFSHLLLSLFNNHWNLF